MLHHVDGHVSSIVRWFWNMPQIASVQHACMLHVASVQLSLYFCHFSFPFTLYNSQSCMYLTSFSLPVTPPLSYLTWVFPSFLWNYYLHVIYHTLTFRFKTFWISHLLYFICADFLRILRRQQSGDWNGRREKICCCDLIIFSFLLLAVAFILYFLGGRYIFCIEFFKVWGLRRLVYLSD